jgi:predicted RNA-binding protein associated with RNAse of E/G family
VPYFNDLFLDYVICENEVEELDRRELEDAYLNGLIEEETYKAVCRHGEMIREYLKEHLDEVIRLMQEIHDILIQTDTDMENLPKLQIETVPQLHIRRKI